MAIRAKTFPKGRIVAGPGAAVKARIVASGLSLSQLARSAGVSPSTLSRYLSGDHSSYDTMHDIWFAYRALTGETPSMRAFWAGLYREPIRD